MVRSQGANFSKSHLNGNTNNDIDSRFQQYMVEENDEEDEKEADEKRDDQFLVGNLQNTKVIEANENMEMVTEELVRLVD